MEDEFEQKEDAPSLLLRPEARLARLRLPGPVEQLALLGEALGLLELGREAVALALEGELLVLELVLRREVGGSRRRRWSGSREGGTHLLGLGRPDELAQVELVLRDVYERVSTRSRGSSAKGTAREGRTCSRLDT